MSPPPASIRFRRPIKLFSSLVELWRARELVRTLAERELRVRYKQAFLGIAWAVLTPLALMVVFTLVFKRIGSIDTGGAPYELFAYVALIPWTFFSTSISHGGQSLIQNLPLLNKIYCPREVFPLASATVAATDAVVALFPLAILFVTTGYSPRGTSLWVPVLLLIQLSFTIGLALFLSAIVVYFRDLKHALPILLQVALFATPVGWGLDVIPVRLQQLYVTVNPLGAVIDGYRRAILLGLHPRADLIIPAAISSVALLLGGYLIFKRLETRFADVA